MSELSDIAASLREHADSLDKVAAAVAAGDTLAEDAAAVVADTAPAGVSAVGWEAFLRGDNPASLSAEDQAGLVAAGKLPDPAPAAPAAPAAPVSVTVSTTDTPPVSTNPGATSPSEPVSGSGDVPVVQSPGEPAGAPEPAGEPVQAGDSAESAATVSGASVPAETEGAPAESVPADESA